MKGHNHKPKAGETHGENLEISSLEMSILEQCPLLPRIQLVRSTHDWKRILNDLNNHLTIVSGGTHEALKLMRAGGNEEERRTACSHLRNVLDSAATVAQIIAGLAHIEVACTPIAEAPRSEPADVAHTILLVDDELHVLKLAKLWLEEKGYKVIEAGNAEQALEESGQQQGTIDLLITDFELDRWAASKVTGKDLMVRLRRTRPAVRVIYISGLPEEEVREYIERDDYFVQKPFLNPLTLTAAVERALREEQGIGR